MKQYSISKDLVSLFLLLALSLPSWALTIDGYEIDRVIPATSQHKEMTLNGASMRVLYGVVDTYIGKLYVETPTTDAQALIDADENKRMVFQVALKRVSGRRMATALYEALQLNTTKEQAMQLEERIQQVVEMFDARLKKGENGYIEWVPGKGSRIVVKGEDKGIIPGKDLNDAIMRIWIGENPVGATFKRQILGLEEYQPPKSVRNRGPR